jgi:hypothetical protein
MRDQRIFRLARASALATTGVRFAALPAACNRNSIAMVQQCRLSQRVVVVGALGVALMRIANTFWQTKIRSTEQRQG